jgi:purine nucleosidase
VDRLLGVGGVTDARIPVFLDCDTGIDDALTIGYLLAQPNVDLVGVGSVSGNIAAATGARNTLDLLAVGGRTDIPVAVGAHDFLGGPFDGGATHVHGDNGIGGVQLPHSGTEPVGMTAAELLVRCAREHPGLRLIAIGPLTNIALALELDPDLPALLPSITVMGGAASVPGNVTPVAEANIWNDVVAAERVFAAAWSVEMVGLDVTMRNLFEEPARDALLGGPPLARALAGMLETYFRFYEGFFGRLCCALHDPLAAAVAIGALPALRAPVVPVTIDATDGPGRGQTIVDLRGRFLAYPQVPGARHRVVLDVADGFPQQLLASLLR